MLIDFDRATMIEPKKPKRQPLKEIVSKQTAIAKQKFGWIR